MTADEIYKILKPYATNDYQNRYEKGDYPESDIPNSIEVWQGGIQVTYKNTSEGSARRWLYKFLRSVGLEVDEDDIETRQDGDYYEDWVQAYWSFKKEKKYEQ